MGEKFREVARAVEFVSSGLAEEYPDAQAEVHTLSRRGPTRTSCAVAELSKVLDGACDRSRGLVVKYHPGNVYGFVAELRPDSDNRRSARSRGRVIILVTEVGGKAIAVGSVPEPRRPLDLEDDFI